MSISVSGLGSGLDYATWIKTLVAAKQTTIDAVSTQVGTISTQTSTLSGLKDNYTSLLDSMQAFTKTLDLNNVFKQKTATSSSSAITADVSAYAEKQSLKVSVTQLASTTTAQSSSVVVSKLDSNTLVSDIASGSVKSGTFSIYVDNTKYSVAVASDSTLGNVLSNITSKTGLAASVDSEGKVTIGAGSSSNIVIGSTSDTSNLSNVLSLAKNNDGSYTSSKSIFDTDTSKALTSTSFASGTVTAGTFTIGSAEFTIGSTTTLSDIVNQINNSTDAGVKAYWDPNAGKLAFESTNAGASNINIEAGTSNFTDVMGLTNSTWNTDGSMKTSELASGSQTLGTNAILSLNGTTITSSSNTITSDISGITGLTLTLNDKTSSTATVNVTNDYSNATSAIESFVSSFNTAITSTDTATSSSGNLYGENILTMLRNKIRNLVTANVDGADGYKNLASIGITTGKVSTDVTADTTKLVIDSTKLAAALKDNPDAVMQLLVGDSTKGTSGVFDKIETAVNNSLDPINGYFTTRATSYTKEAKSLNTKITSMTTALADYKTQLETKFAAMDKLISSLKNSASIFDSYFNTSNSSSSKSSSSSSLTG